MTKNSMLQTLRKPHLIKALRLCILKNEKLMDSNTDNTVWQSHNQNFATKTPSRQGGVSPTSLSQRALAGCGACVCGELATNSFL